MSTLAKLKSAATFDEVARLLGFKPKFLAFILYGIPDAKKYTSFEIPKRSGGKRLIKAPIPQLALLQRRLAKVLYDSIDELGVGSPPPRRSLAHGFVRRRSIITNASLHKRRRYVLNLDLENFFPSINFGRVRGFFLKDKHFALHEKAATVLAQIACCENELPQGSPCSPVVSNLIGHLLDSRLARFAKIHRCTFSRYADDITFSTSRKNFPAELAFPVPGTNLEWQLGAALRKKIEDSGFKINEKKTRMQFRNSRQVTTGLMVNEKVNIRQEYWRSARQMCRALFSTGSYHRVVPAALAGGSPGDPPVKLKADGLNPIEGMLAHIHQVKNKEDFRKISEKRKSPTAAWKLYRNFLFYKNFLALDRPLIVPEGKTDSIYLKCAIRYLPSYHPQLGEIEKEGFKSKLRFMRYSAIVHDVLELGYGSSQLNTLIARYEADLKYFSHAPVSFPVIILIDNDDGGAALFKNINSKSKLRISYESKEVFYHLGGNLYVVKIPEKSSAPYISRIEDLFDPALLATKLDGKSFDPEEKYAGPDKYGKSVFATRVVEPNASTIDFTKFGPLLDRIVAVLDHYGSPTAGAGST